MTLCLFIISKEEKRKKNRRERKATCVKGRVCQLEKKRICFKP